VITEDEAMAMVRSANKARDKAFIAVLYEGGFRIGEALTARVGDLEFDENGAKLKVHGKTGGRTVRLITSVPLLARWLEEHPFNRKFVLKYRIWPIVSGAILSYLRPLVTLQFQFEFLQDLFLFLCVFHRSMSS